MNKHLHRLVFSAARGQFVAVQETASATGKNGERKRAPLLSAALAAAVGMLFTAGAAQAQVVADPAAPGAQRPTVLQSANGVTQVNIQTPSAAGVSRNTYSQFDVDRRGLILNNSRTSVQTQLGGFVQGNPWLAAGSAVSSSTRSTRAAPASCAATSRWPEPARKSSSPTRPA